jgi:hypothetical protein
MATLLDWVQVNGSKLDQLRDAQTELAAEFKQEAELKLHEYLMLTSQMLDDRDHTAAPGLISVTTKDRSKWNPSAYFRNTYVLTPYCECPGNIHSCEDGHVEFTKDRDWWEKSAPWIARGTKLLSAGLQLAFAGMPLALGNDVFDTIKNEVKFMEELGKHLALKDGTKESTPGVGEVVKGDGGKDLRGSDRDSKLTRSALALFLEDVAPTNYRARQWGSLRRVKMSDDSYRWLCGDCADRTR